MKNKNSVLGGIGVLALICVGFFPVNTEAVFRGQDMMNLIEMVKAKRLARRGVRVERARDTSGDLEESTFSQDTEKRAARMTTGRRLNFYTTTKQIAPQQKFHDFSVSNEFGFAIALPRGFVKKQDSLSASAGSVEFETVNTNIKISALGNVCEGGVVAIQDCLNVKSDEFTDELEKNYPSGIILKKEIVKLRTSDSQRFEHDNSGKEFTFDIGDERIGVLTFFDKNMKYLWRMEITAPDNYSGVLNQGGVLNKIMESLFVVPKNDDLTVSVSRRVTKMRANNRLRSKSIGRRSSTVGIVSSSSNKSYSAQNMPFVIEVPKNSHRIEDSLLRDGGELRFKSGEGEIVITAMRDVCSSQSQPVVRKCVEAHARDIIEQFHKENPDMTSLGSQNYQLRLTSNVGLLFVARGDILMQGSDRGAVFVFSEPEYGNVWKLVVSSNKGQDGVLGDVRKMKNLLGSMRFIK